jgi:hypothetical protein
MSWEHEIVKAPAPGVLLFSSCLGEDAFRIRSVGSDVNGTPCVDLDVFDLNAMLHFTHVEQDDPARDIPGFGFAPFTRLDVPEDLNPVLRNVQYKHDPEGRYPETIVLNMPEGGCYRCCYLFNMHTGARRR